MGRLAFIACAMFPVQNNYQLCSFYYYNTVPMDNIYILYLKWLLPHGQYFWIPVGMAGEQVAVQLLPLFCLLICFAFCLGFLLPGFLLFHIVWFTLFRSFCFVYWFVALVLLSVYPVDCFLYCLQTNCEYLSFLFIVKHFWSFLILVGFHSLFNLNVDIFFIVVI